ncbi:MAG: efflux RND transporter permease subunit [Archangiaceae bacterium]|nr:efflux RND transporter permease subunit [Archangiaceae bacterium]
MQWLAELCVKRPVFAAVLTLVTMVVGGVFVTQLGVDQFPKIDFPVIVVSTVLPGASPEDVETSISDKIEGAVNTINGIDELRSISSEGFSQVLVQFVLEKNVDVASAEVQQKVNTVLAELPKGIDPPIVQKFDPDAVPILFIALNGKDKDIREITDIADRVVRRRLESISGVGQVVLIGGRKRQIDVQVDPVKLRGLGITPAEVAAAINAQNMTLPGGRIETSRDFLTVKVNGRVTSVDELKGIIVREQSGRAVRLDELAEVRDTVEDVSTSAQWNGTPTVLMALRKQSGTNTVAVVDAVRERIGELQKELPQGYSLDVQRDGSQVVRTGTKAVVEHLVLGALLAALIVLVFLGNLRSTVIAAIAIPTSIVGTFALMKIQGYTLNSITLLALALAVGIVIDDAIVVLEIIFKHVEEKGVDPATAAIEGTREIGTAVLATTLSLVAVFLPIAFVAGIPGRFLSSFGITMSFSIVVSLFVSFTLTPMLASKWLKQKAKGDHSKSVLEKLVDVGYRPVEGVYGRALAFVMRHRWLVVIASLLALVSIVPMGKAARKGFLPVDDRAQFEVVVRLPEGRSVASAELVGARVARIIREVPEVNATMMTVGDDPAKTPNQARIFVKLVDPDKRARSQNDIKDYVRTKILPTLAPDLRVTVADVNEFGGGQATQRVQYIIAGPDLKVLEQATKDVIPKVKALPGAVDVDSSLVTGKPEITIHIDRDRAADLGVQVADVASALQLLIAGQKVSSYEERGEQYDVRLRATQSYRTDEDMLQLITVPSRKVGMVSLADVVTLGRDESLSSIQRYQRERQVVIMANAGPGASEGDIADSILKTLQDQHLPKGFSIKAQGQTKLMKETGLSFILGLLASMVFMYLILAAQFESWLHPITILISLPLTLPFAIASVIIFGQALDLYSFLGIFVLFGVVKKNGILQVAHTDTLRDEWQPKLAAAYARVDRTLPPKELRGALKEELAGLLSPEQVDRALAKSIKGDSLPYRVLTWMGMFFMAIPLLAQWVIPPNRRDPGNLHDPLWRALDDELRLKAILQGNKDRLRPILMTTFAFVAGMIPLVTARGIGSGFNKATAGVVIGGQVLSLLLTLLAVPVAYSWLDHLSVTFRRLFQQRGEKAPAPVPASPPRHAPPAGVAEVGK